MVELNNLVFERLILAVLVLVITRCGGAPFSGYCSEPAGEQSYEHGELCDHYILCVNGSASVQRCENGLLYDGKGKVHEHCNYNWEVDCGQRKADHVVPESSDGCEYKFGIYAESSSCSTQFLKCAHGYAERTACEPGLAYDERIKKCNWPDLLLEQCNPEEVIGFKCPDRVDPKSAAARFWPYPRFAIPGECDRSITCVDGHPRLITCGDNLVFDDETLTCTEPENSRKRC